MWFDFILPVVLVVAYTWLVSHTWSLKDYFVRVYLMQSRQSVLVNQIGVDATVEQLPCWEGRSTCANQDPLRCDCAKLWSRYAGAPQTPPLTTRSTTISLDQQLTE